MTDVQHAIEVLNQGGIVIYPTDTAFGIGCRIDMPEAVDRLFELRRRPLTQATPLLVDTEAMALLYFDAPSQIVRRFMVTYWPGALTIVAPVKKEKVYSPLRGSTELVGLRCPNHDAARQMIAGVGVPVVGPSANFHGMATPYRLEDLDPELIKLVDFVLSGQCQLKQASTVVDCSANPYRIIRQGAVQLL
jgi:L-threonylcarbamoyladenylate synthase